MQKYQLAIFDYDGTLADSRQAIIESMSHALRAAGAQGLLDEQIPEWIGLPLEKMVEQLLTWSNAYSKDREAAVLEKYRAVYSDLCTRHTRLFPGMRQVLDKARAAGIRLAIATSKGHAGLQHSGTNLGILPLFDSIRTADSVTHHKPHPEAIESILAELGVAHEATVMIGDTFYDMEMGRRAGVDTIAVTYGVHDVARLEKAHPKHMVSAAADIWPLLSAA